MPIENGKYKNPGWANGKPPALNAPELNAISDSLERLDQGGGGSSAPVVRQVTLTSAGWSNNRQTVTVQGVLAGEGSQIIEWTPAITSQDAAYAAGILCAGNAANSLTFTAKTKPTQNLTIYVTLQGVGT